MRSLIVVGLGNPGEEFAGTRHNLGIEVVRRWAGSVWQTERSWPAEVAEVESKAVSVKVLFPLTFMNGSGEAVARFFNYYHLSPADLVVVHDDMELPLGEVRRQAGGSAKGHNGVRSVQQALSTNDFMRLRLGIGRPEPGITPDQFVLAKFPSEEADLVGRMEKQAVVELENLVTDWRPSQE